MLHLNHKKLQELSGKWLSGTITAEEQQILDEWYNQESVETIDWESDDPDEDHLRERIFVSIKEVQQNEPPRIKFLKKSQTRKAAAVMMIVLIGCGIFFLLPYLKHAPVTQNNIVAKKDKAPANKAILTLADGSKIILDNANNGLVAKEGSTQVHKENNGALKYSTDAASDVQKPQMNSISTSVGGQYEVTLCDGSKVWLNALSTLKFPTAFIGNERVVELTGEAYFEVEKNKKMPFKVNLANNTSIKVLGTHFNIMAYSDEKHIDATLLEGSINVNKGDITQTISPGQQAKIADNIKISEVNADEAIAWKKGLFSFEKTDTENMMRQIGRWYGVDIVYQGKIPANQFTGYIARNSDLTEVLKMLQISGLKTAMNNRKITVLNN